MIRWHAFEAARPFPFRRMTRPGPCRTAVAALALAMLTGACGSDDDTPLATAPAESTTPATSAAQAAPVVLEVSDLPAGWEELPVEPSDGEEAASCTDALVDGSGPFDEAAIRTFGQSSLGPFLTTASTSGSSDALAEVERIITACDGQTDTDGFTTSIEEAEAPDVGDDAVAFRATATNEHGSSVSFLIAAAEAGDVVAMVGQAVSLGELDPQLVADVLATMVDRAGS